MKNRVTPDSYFIFSLALSILFHMAIPLARLIPFPWNLFGIILIIAGIIMTLMTNSPLLNKKTSVQSFDNSGCTIDFRTFQAKQKSSLPRHAIAFVGAVITLGSLSPFIFPIIFVIIINWVIIPFEKNKLEMVFGDKYLDYKTKTRRWF